MKRFGGRAGRFFVLLAMTVLSAAPASPRQEPAVEIIGWDLSALDARVTAAAAKATARGAGAAEKKAAARAFLERANFFWGAGVPGLYKYAAGDFRRTLRLDPAHREAREKLETIVSIYESLGRAAPDLGSEKYGERDLFTRFELRPEPLGPGPGRSSAVASGTVSSGGVTYVYEVKVEAGQALRIGIESPGRSARFAASRHGGGAPAHIPPAVQLDHLVKEAGTFLVRVIAREPDTSYKLTVEIR